MTKFEVTTNPFRPDVALDSNIPYIGVPLWKITTKEHYNPKLTDEHEFRISSEYCLAYSMEEAIETAKAKWRMWSEHDESMVSVHILSVEFLADSTLFQKELADDVLSEWTRRAG